MKNVSLRSAEKKAIAVWAIRLPTPNKDKPNHVMKLMKRDKDLKRGV